MDISQIIVTGLASSVGALFSAFIGAKFAIDKYQKEKGFDARLEWHRNIGDVSRRLRNRTKAFKYFKSQENKEALNSDLIKEIGDLSFKFQELAEQSPMYANTDTHREIAKVISYMNSLTSSFEKAVENLENKNHPINLSLVAMSLVYDLVARDIRAMTGLKKLPEQEKLDIVG